MKHSQSNEDYLETILLLSGKQDAVHRIDVARAVGVSQPAVQKAIKILIAQGYVVTDGMHIHLTESGREATRLGVCGLAGVGYDLLTKPELLAAVRADFDRGIREQDEKGV